MKTTTHQMPFLSEIESGQPIPVGKLAYLCERTRLRLYDFIVSKFLEQSRDNQLTQAELARRVRKSPEVINRLLGAPGNWTIDTITELLVGISAEELEPDSVSLLNQSARNQTFPEWLLELQAPSTQNKGLDAKDILEGQGQIENEYVRQSAIPVPALDHLT